ncbi:hypothetical protein BO70DRAFT_381810 [Aspergillus heteromorphus CBS 117.55]|uniref:Zn(2)-C6 fungal-type domain-containing protein n=1 Tax=Aspergillus heteromorphus CBS 117.55 TaxID=1448321 RepID=A0A317VH86_9EURO|nr:uncharacterized protein BO70DRAFT_381810 [Aspergillus heteromorphus CBS 117.55]PWY72262.1 hypothetical protein BO70DRAFT_381810 [Aspergillus heteromorphus CBS 117.55]
MSAPRKKVFSKRSRAGCRTCRARHVKCDETPGACRNCTSSGRTCEGYDVCRLGPGGGNHGEFDGKPALELQAAMTVRLAWTVTSDERRCLSFFQYRSIPHLVGFYDSPLWQKMVLRLCRTEPAVYHAVIALGAVNQANEIAGRVPRPGQRNNPQACKSRWYRFALEQSGRSIALLNRRRLSQDPQFQDIILVCCLLFTICELLHGNRNLAISHVQGGLRILHTMQIQRQGLGLEVSRTSGQRQLPTGAASPLSTVAECVVETFLNLQESSIFFGAQDPLEFDRQFVLHQPYEDYLRDFRSLQHAQQAFKPLFNATMLFTSTYMKSSDSDLQTNYATLQHQQLRIMSCLHQFVRALDLFCVRAYGMASTTLDGRTKDRREAELIRLCCGLGLLSAKVALYPRGESLPSVLTGDCEALIEAAERAMSHFGQDAPACTDNMVFVPTLYIGVFRCPDYGLRIRGIEDIRSWRSEEGFMSATWVADILEEGMKLELKRMHEADAPRCGVTFETDEDGNVSACIPYRVGTVKEDRYLPLQRNEEVIADLLAIENAKDWPCVRGYGLLKHLGM